mgnify:FL=1
MSQSRRRQQHGTLYPLYRLTAPLRPLPDAVIIGAMKCGTTSLNAWLRHHPQVLFPCRKELHYFDQHPDRSVGWYRSHFPLRSHLFQPRQNFCAIEATPAYIFREEVPERMYRLLPQAKLIAILRDPVRRAISHYDHRHRHGRELRPISEALMASHDLDDQGLKVPDNLYKRRGHYAEQLERVLHFYPREQLLVLRSEDLFSDPDGIYRQVLDYLGLDSSQPLQDRRPRNVSRQKHEVPDEVIAHLKEHFREPNVALGRLLPDFPIWES